MRRAYICIRSIDRTKHWSRTSTFHTIHHITHPIITVVRIRNNFSLPPLRTRSALHHKPPPNIFVQNTPPPHPDIIPLHPPLIPLEIQKNALLPSQSTKNNSPHSRPTKGCLYMHNSFMTIQPPPPAKDNKKIEKQPARARARAIKQRY